MTEALQFVLAASALVMLLLWPRIIFQAFFEEKLKYHRNVVEELKTEE